jgi:hypothetical protein
MSWYTFWVEKYYTNGFYPKFTFWLRKAFGFIPFSIGDLFYSLLILAILLKLFSFLKFIKRKEAKREQWVRASQQSIFFLLFLYVLFNLCWGLNYNRQGVAKQFSIQLTTYDIAELDSLTVHLQEKANFYAQVASRENLQQLKKKKLLFEGVSDVYKEAQLKYNFLSYHPHSIKPSIFSYLGNYIGFQGYYNPFTGEGQVNTTIPVFLQPYVATHEVAHQLGYASESEANFIGYLACKSSSSNEFKYSVYLDLYRYAIGELSVKDSSRAKIIYANTDTLVKKDIKSVYAFYKQYRNPFEQIIWWGYDHFLKANNQPNGNQSYNEVIAWLIAYQRKNGKDVI